MSNANQFLISVAGPTGAIPGFFQTKRGGRPNVQSQRDYDGGSDVPIISTGRIQYDALTVGRRFDYGRDVTIISGNRPYVGNAGATWTVTVQPTDAAYVAQGQATVYTGILVGQSDPDVDVNSTTPARYELTFEVISMVTA